MKMNSKSVMISALLFLCVSNCFASSTLSNSRYTIYNVPGTETLVVKIEEEKDRMLEKFLGSIIMGTGLEKKIVPPSDALLRCYIQLRSNTKEVDVNDLQIAMPEILEALDSYCNEHSIDLVKAPRPAGTSNAVVGPGCCDLNSVLIALGEILDKLALLNESSIDIINAITDLKATISTDYYLNVEHEARRFSLWYHFLLDLFVLL